MRDIPIFTFINKMDREARDPFELCQELEHEVGIDTATQSGVVRLDLGGGGRPGVGVGGEVDHLPVLPVVHPPPGLL